jgi:hypothetical protein
MIAATAAAISETRVDSPMRRPSSATSGTTVVAATTFRAPSHRSEVDTSIPAPRNRMYPGVRHAVGWPKRS